jgi:hypothetical protein
MKPGQNSSMQSIGQNHSDSTCTRFQDYEYFFKKESMFLFLFLVIGNLFEVYDISPNILGDLLDLKLPEMGQLDLDGAARDRNDPEHRLLDPFADLHPLSYIDLHLHGCSPHHDW